MDKIKAYEELLNRALDSLKAGTFCGEDRKEADKLYDDIKSALSKPETETDDGWISVDDAKPDVDCTVLVYHKYEGIKILDYDSESGTFGYEEIEVDEMGHRLAEWYDYENSYITHWRPLPNDLKENE